jgi:hypothetical protein
MRKEPTVGHPLLNNKQQQQLATCMMPRTRSMGHALLLSAHRYAPMQLALLQDEDVLHGADQHCAAVMCAPLQHGY